LMATKDPRPIVAICGVCSRRRARYRCLAYPRIDRASRSACVAAEGQVRFWNVQDWELIPHRPASRRAATGQQSSTAARRGAASQLRKISAAMF
jgi:hypothetical protein